MRVAKVSELIGTSTESFDDAARTMLRRVNQNLRGITGIEVISKRVEGRYFKRSSPICR